MSGSAAGPALALHDVTVSYGKRRALNQLRLIVPSGTCYGIVGPNGAGKTTALAIAVGLRRPHSGTVHIHGVDLWQEQSRAKGMIGFLPADLALPDQLTGREALRYLGMLRGLDARTVEKRASELLTLLGLAPEGTKPIVDYSTGMRKKLGLALAILHGPPLVVLDEPLEAVDPVSTMIIRAIIHRIVAGGRTVILSSHDMPLIEQLCDRLAMIDDGRLVASGSIRDVLGRDTLTEMFAAQLGFSTAPLIELDWL